MRKFTSRAEIDRHCKYFFSQSTCLSSETKSDILIPSFYAATFPSHRNTLFALHFQRDPRGPATVAVNVTDDNCRHKLVRCRKLSCSSLVAIRHQMRDGKQQGLASQRGLSYLFHENHRGSTAAEHQCDVTFGGEVSLTVGQVRYKSVGQLNSLMAERISGQTTGADEQIPKLTGIKIIIKGAK